MRSVVVAISILVAAAVPHEDRLAQIKEIQNTPGVLWKATVSGRFASEAPGASKPLCGVKGNWSEQIEAAVARGDVHRFTEGLMDSQEDPPESFDSATNWPKCAKVIGDIRDQSNCGCCWAFAGAEAASDRMCIATNAEILEPLSAQDVCFCSSSDGCDGGQIETPWDYIKNTGAVTGGQYQGTGPFGKGMCADFSMPHCHHHGPRGKDPYPNETDAGCPSQSSAQCPSKCDAGAAASHSDFESDKYSFTGEIVTAGGLFGGGAKGIQKLIQAGGPVETAFTVYSDFENYAGGVYHHVTGESVGGHAVKIVGWGVDTLEGQQVQYWKVANSWNPYWAEDGYFRIKIGDMDFASSVIGSSPDAKWGKKSSTNSVVV